MRASLTVLLVKAGIILRISIAPVDHEVDIKNGRELGY